MNGFGFMRDAFAHEFEGTPAVSRAPGRVNLIGEHTDYNDGFVLPVAIDLYTYAAACIRSDGRVRVRSLQQPDGAEFSVTDAASHCGRTGHWSDYIVGVVRVLRDYGVHLTGADLLVHGEVPLGAGLSSSAALGVAAAQVLLDLAGADIPPPVLATLCQRAENEFVGTRCGIMDQYASAYGSAGHALLLDCRTVRHELVPLDGIGPTSDRTDVSVVICNTMVRHELASGEYNVRRAECAAGVAEFVRRGVAASALRDVSPVTLARHAATMDRTLLRRCRHVIHENGRVADAAAALRKGDFARVGRLMYASHASLRDDFEVSCEELDTMVDIAARIPGVYGARMTGGGFGGCTVNLVRAESATRFAHEVRTRYLAATGKDPTIRVCASADGACRLHQ